MTFSYLRQVGSQIFTLWCWSCVMLSLILSFDFYLWASHNFLHVFIFLFSLSFAFTTLPILPVVCESLPSSIPVLHLLSCCPSGFVPVVFCIFVVTFVTPGRAQNRRSQCLPGLFICYHVAVRTRYAHKPSINHCVTPSRQSHHQPRSNPRHC